MKVFSKHLKTEKTLTKICLVLILLLGTFFRFYHSNTNFVFQHEQADDLFAVKGIWDSLKSLDFGSLPLRGQEGTFNQVGGEGAQNPIYHGVFYYYFLLPASLLSSFDPYGVVIFLILLGILSIYLIYLVSKSLFNNETTSLLAAFFYASSFWLSAYSRWIWTPSLVPFFILLGLLGLLKVREGKMWGWYFLVFGSAAASQVHASGFLFLAGVLVASLVLKLKIPKSWVSKLAILAILVIILGPFVIGEIGENFGLVKGILRAIATVYPRSLNTPFWLEDVGKKFVDFISFLLSYNHGLNFSLGRISFFGLLWGALVIGLIGAIISFIKENGKIKLQTKNIFIFFFSLPFIFLPYLASKYYARQAIDTSSLNVLLFMVPFVFLLSARFLTYLGRKIYWLPFVVIVFGGVTLLNVLNVRVFLFDKNDDFNYGFKKDLVRYIAEDSKARPYELYFLPSPRNEIVYIAWSKNYPLPQRYNGKSLIGYDREGEVVLENSSSDFLYTIIDGENLAQSVEEVGNLGLLITEMEGLRIYKRERNVK